MHLRLHPLLLVLLILALLQLLISRHILIDYFIAPVVALAFELGQVGHVVCSVGVVFMDVGLFFHGQVHAADVVVGVVGEGLEL